MNKKILIQFFSYMLLLSSVSFAQKASVSVNPLTGSGSVAIPIYTMSSGQVSVPVALVYSGTGVRPKEIESPAGMGWTLQAGGQISRQVRGIPDDCTKDNGSHTMLGWMSTSNTAASAISSFSIANNGGVTCSNETSDISYITSNFPYYYDTEPDIFNVNAPGLSCQLVYDRVSGKFKPVNYQDLVITYTTNPGTGSQPNQITTFTITNDKGIVYTFAQGDIGPSAETVTETTSGGSQIYFSTKYKQYQYGITYYDNWVLSGITDPNGNSVQMTYTSYPARNSTDSVALYIGGATSSSLQYYIKQAVTPMELTSIVTTTSSYSSVQYLNFSWATLSTSGLTGQTVLTGITGFGRNIQLNYTGVKYTPTGYTRSFLRRVYDAGCSSPIDYQFSYIGESLSAGNYSTTLPDSASNKTDYWGYYTTATGTSASQLPSVYVSPSSTSYPQYVIGSSSTNAAYTYFFSNTSRLADATNVTIGSLNKISYVAGGSTNIVYESNDYYDVPKGAAVQGGGIRVKQVIDSVSTTSTNNIVRNYSYVNPSTGVTSGKPVSLPQYAFAIPYGGTATGYSFWADGTVLSAHDLSGEDHTIMYGYTKESQTGAGSTIYQYYVPATSWDVSATPACSGCSTEWYPTINYVGRANCSSPYGPLSNYTNSYPFIPNPNYDFERGLPQKVTSYNDAGGEVSESNYTYSRSFSPSVITAFKYDDNPNGTLSAKGYNKYNIYWNTSELTTTAISKVYDSGNAGLSRSDTTTFTYGSSNHKYATQIQKTNSDRNVYTTNIKYVKDYAPTNGTNANIKALYNLQQLNINAPVETYQQVTPHGGSTLTTGASLTLFQGFTPGSTTLYLPSQQRKLIQPDGASFTPFSINTSSQTISYDANYFPVANYQQYDNTGFPITVDDANKHIQTTIVDHLTNHVTASFKNAAFNEVAFNDFDTKGETPFNTFTIGGSGSFTPVGSHAGGAGGMASTNTATSGTLTKNAAAKNYIFSIWINAVTGGTLTLTLSGISPNPSFTYTGGGVWKYYELKIPAASLSSSYTVSFQPGTSVSIDDVLFYPDVVEVGTATYDPTTHFKVAETNTNGVSAYFTNDQWGRMLYAYDQDKNIVQKNTFITPANAATYAVTPIVGGSISATNGVATSFSIIGPDACAAAGTTVSWNFGDGTTPTAAGLVSPSHTYHAVGTYTVSATVNSPLFGTKTATSLTVTVSPYSIPLSYSNFTTGNGNISNVTFTPVGTGTSYSFSGSQLSTAHVLQGTYTISVTLSGGTHYNSGTGLGYNCVYLNGDCNSTCANWVSSNSYTFSSLNITSCTTFNFTVSQYDCSHFIGIE